MSSLPSYPLRRVFCLFSYLLTFLGLALPDVLGKDLGGQSSAASAMDMRGGEKVTFAPVYSERIRSLVGQMTLEEKAGQLAIFLPSTIIRFHPDTALTADEIADRAVRDARAGAFYSAGVTRSREYQRMALEESRLGIPLIFLSGGAHGMRTVFPVPLGETASFEPELARRTTRAVAVEATAGGGHWTFAPTVDLGRDQRWGRITEGAGEDVFLNSVFAVARVKGF